MFDFVTGVTHRSRAQAAAAEWIGDDWPVLKRVRRRLLMPLFRIPDTGLLGLTQLRKHILICGFPRSGTTLLQLMLENALPQARRFGREVGGWRAATFAWRNHPLLISKVPHDVFRLDALRNFYVSRPASLRIIMMIRDPRDVLTSQRKDRGSDQYVVTPHRWLRYYQAVQRHRHAPDVLEVRYEDLVGASQRQQERIEGFLGVQMSIPFCRFHEVVRPDFDISTLNGLRPIEQSPVARWTDDCHRSRIGEVLAELPGLPEAIVELGYAEDDSWVPRLK
jgi:hypothetical protein